MRVNSGNPKIRILPAQQRPECIRGNPFKPLALPLLGVNHSFRYRYQRHADRQSQLDGSSLPSSKLVQLYPMLRFVALRRRQACRPSTIIHALNTFWVRQRHLIPPTNRPSITNVINTWCCMLIGPNRLPNSKKSRFRATDVCLKSLPLIRLQYV